MPGEHGKATYGGEKQKAYVKCPQCGYRVVVADPEFLDRGPIRCGNCGAEIQGAMLRRTIADALSPHE